MTTADPNYMSKRFGTFERAFRLLEDNGVDPFQFHQRIIDEPAFRASVVNLFGGGISWDLLLSQPATLDTFLDNLFFDDDRVRLRPPKGWRHLSNLARFQFLADGLSPRDLDILCKRACLYTSTKARTKDVAKEYGIRHPRDVQRIASTAYLHMRQRAHQLANGEIVLSES